jgi:vacuolar protein sorting-associated protein 45
MTTPRAEGATRVSTNDTTSNQCDRNCSGHRLCTSCFVFLPADISSIADMARFIDRFPELKSKGLAASKHVALMSTIANAVESRNLFDLSEIEQNMVASTNDGDASQHFRDITDTIARLNGFSNPYAADGRGGAGATAAPLPPGSKPVDPFDALRLLMLYCLRYERAAPSKCADLKRFIADKAGVGSKHIELVDQLLSYGGQSVRANDLFNTGAVAGGAGGGAAGGASGAAVFSRFTSAFKNMAGSGGGGGLSGVSNVYTQHQPYVVSLLSELAKGKLKTTAFPYTGNDPGAGVRYGTVIVFIVGGVTFEEAAKVGAVNSGSLNITGSGSGPSSFVSGAAGSAVPPFRVILGGTNVLNSSNFVAELMSMRDGGSSSSSLQHTSIDMGSGAGVGTVHYSSSAGVGGGSYGSMEGSSSGVRNWS